MQKPGKYYFDRAIPVALELKPGSILQLKAAILFSPN